MLTALDTETTLIFPGRLVPMMVCVSWATEAGSGVLHRNDPEARRLVHKAFEGHTVFANAPFDLAVFLRWDPSLHDAIWQALEEGRVHDVQTRQKLIDIAAGMYRKEVDEDGNVKRVNYSLAELVRRIFRRTMDKDTWRLRYHDLIDVDIEHWPDGALKYATDDAEATLAVFDMQERVREPDERSCVLDDEPYEVRAHWSLHLASSYGLHTNPEVVARLRKGTEEKIAELTEELRKHKLVDSKGKRNTGRAKQIMRQVVDPEDIELTPAGAKLVAQLTGEDGDDLETARAKAIKDGHISLSETPCMESGDSRLIAYTQYAKLQNVLKKDVKFLERGSVTPIQTRFEILMETGRTSSSGPNVQNLRRDMDIFDIVDETGQVVGRSAPGVRDCFEPRDGYWFFAADFSSAELVSLAQVCLRLVGHSRLAELLNDGVDPHLWLAANVARVSYDDALALRTGKVSAIHFEDGQKITAKQIKHYRQMGKAASFGYPGGMGPKRFIGYAKGYGLELSLEQAIELRDTWRNAFPEMEEYHRKVKSFTYVDDEFFETIKHFVPPTGFRHRLRSGCTFPQAANSRFQGHTADYAKHALYEVTREQFCEPSSALYGTACVNFVHDEIVGEALIEQAPAAADRLAEVMVGVGKRYCPDVRLVAEPVVMRWWAKGAETRRVNGVLVPHEGGPRP